MPQSLSDILCVTPSSFVLYRKLIFPLQYVHVVNSSLVRAGALCPLPLFPIGIFFCGVDLYRSWPCCHSWCEFMCASIPSVAWRRSPESFTPLPVILLSPLLHSSLRPERRGLVKSSHLGMNAPNSLKSARLPVVGLCITSHPLQEEASPMREDAELWHVY